MSNLLFFAFAIFVYLAITGLLFYLGDKAYPDSPDEWLETSWWPGSLEPPKQITVSKFQKFCFQALGPFLILPNLLFNYCFSIYYRYQSSKAKDPFKKAQYKLQSLLAADPYMWDLLDPPDDPQTWLDQQAQIYINET